jgi:hypothetical protein
MGISHLPVQPRPPPCRALRSDASDDRDAFHRVTPDRVSPGRRAALALGLKASRGCAHRSRFGGAADRVSGHAVDSSASALAPIRLATPRAPRRAMRRTDFCHLTSSYEHPRLAGFRSVTRLRSCVSDNRLVHIRAIGFGGLHDSLSCHRVGHLPPTAMREAEPLTSLSPLPPRLWRSRVRESR